MNLRIGLWITSFNLALFFCAIYYFKYFSERSPYVTKESLSKSTPETELEIRKKKGEKYIQSLSVNKESWINPNDMFNFKGFYYDEESHFPDATVSEDKGEIRVDGDAKNDEENRKEVPIEDGLILHHVKLSKNDAYLSRWLKKILAKMEGWSIEGSDMVIQFPLSSKMPSIIKEMLQIEPLDVQELGDIIDTMISESVLKTKDTFLQSLYSYSSNFLIYVVLSLIALATAIIILYFLLLRRLKLFLLILFMCVSVAWHWMNLYQQKRAEQFYHLQSVDLENECQVKDKGFLKSVYFFISSYLVSDTKCRNYYKATMVDPMWEVSLSVALSETIFSFVFHSLKVLSTVCSYCARELFTDSSIIHVGILMFFLSFILMMTFGYRFRLPFWVAFEPSNRPSRVQEIIGSSLHLLTSSNTDEDSTSNCVE